jgi:hypothetical protein
LTQKGLKNKKFGQLAAQPRAFARIHWHVYPPRALSQSCDVISKWLPFVRPISPLRSKLVVGTRGRCNHRGHGPGYKYLGSCTKSAMSHVELCWLRRWAVDESEGRRSREHRRRRQSALCVIPQARWVVLGHLGFPSHMLVASPGENHGRGTSNCSLEQSASAVPLVTLGRSVVADN